MFFLTRNIIILSKSSNLQKKISMKLTFLSVGLCLGISFSLAQNNFQNIWKSQSSSDQIEIKISQSKQESSLSFVLEGLMRQSSRIFITGSLKLNALNEYVYQDEHSNCRLQFNFTNKDSLILQANLCELYMLNDTIDGLYTSNFKDLITPKILGEYNDVLEKEIENKTGEDFERIKAKSIYKKQINSDSISTIYMAETDALMRRDPQVVYYIKNNRISIFYRFKDVIHSYISPYHRTISDEISQWIQKDRVTETIKQ